MPSILIVDDSITVRQGIKMALKKIGLFSEYYEAQEGREALRLLDEREVDLVMCDVVMPEMDGFEFLREMKSGPRFAEIPVIMLTGQESVEKKIHGLDLGASDYITKPFDPGELIARVKVQMKIKSLQDELKAANENLRKLSVTDYLTKLHNRRHFMELLQVEFGRCKRHNLPLSFIILDIDHFKRVNDTKGHLAGDQVLTELGRILKSNLRAHDVVARYGGEEFVILLPMAQPNEAIAVAEKIRRRVERHYFSGVDGEPMTVSFGVASYPHPPVDNIDQLIARGDNGLYAAKEAGRNRTMFNGDEGVVQVDPDKPIEADE